MAKTLSRLISPARARTDAKHAQNAAFNQAQIAAQSGAPIAAAPQGAQPFSRDQATQLKHQQNAAYNAAVQAGTQAARTFDPAQMSQQEVASHNANMAYNEKQGAAHQDPMVYQGQATAAAGNAAGVLDANGFPKVNYTGQAASHQMPVNAQRYRGEDRRAVEQPYQGEQRFSSQQQAAGVQGFKTQPGIVNAAGQADGQMLNGLGQNNQQSIAAFQNSPWGNVQQPQRSANHGGQYRVSPGVYRNRPAPMQNATPRPNWIQGGGVGNSPQPWMRKM